MTLLLQSHAIWVEERWGNILEACKQDVCLADWAKHGGVRRRHACEKRAGS